MHGTTYKTNIYNRGWRAYEDGLDENDCPWPMEYKQSGTWLNGFNECRDNYEERDLRQQAELAHDEMIQDMELLSELRDKYPRVTT